jgi:purine-binding chemotaxis protein CheW
MTPDAATKNLDWKQLRDRLEGIWQAYADELEPSSEAALEILQSRARDAAAVLSDATAGDGEEILRFTARQEPYALATRHVWEICRVTRVARLPRSPRHLAGVSNLKGVILPLIDLDWLLRGDEDKHFDHPFAIVIGETAPELGVLAERLDGFDHLCAGHLMPLPRAANKATRHLARGLTSKGVVVLDDTGLLHDPRLYFGSSTHR